MASTRWPSSQAASLAIAVAVLLAATAAPDGARAPGLARQAEIRRTAYGVPHIRADNLEAAAYALAWVQLEDHGPRIAARHAHAHAVTAYPSLDRATRDVYDGFAAGVNRWVELHPEELPAGFSARFTGADVLAREMGLAPLPPGRETLGMPMPIRTTLTLVLALLARPATAQQAPSAGYDVVIRGGRVLDGTGNPWYYADVGIAGDRIVAVGDLTSARAKRVIDARGLYVAPGFIDSHSHAGPGLATPALSGAGPLLTQGITTVVVNPDGGGPVDLAAQRRRLGRRRPGVNVALLVPHGSVRAQVLGMEDRAPTAAELGTMEGLVRRGMSAGAFGLSSGPFYAPGSFARTEELIALARVAAIGGGVYTSHIRDESDYSIGVVAAVDEVIRIAREARLPGIVTHIKALGPHVWGTAPVIIAHIDSARAQGVEVFADQYPYDASSTSLSAALVPRWALAGGDSALARRLADGAERVRIEREMRDNLGRRGGAARIRIARYLPDTSIEGRSLQQVADAAREEPLATAMRLIARGHAGIVSFNMDSGDIAALMRQRWTMTSSDGDLVPMGEGVPHPRAYGTFPRKLRKYALDERVVELADAVRGMTTLPATVFRMEGRGSLRPGAHADVVVFDAARIRDRATYDDPHQLSEGVVHVLVNGTLAVDRGSVTGVRGGRVLSRIRGRSSAGGAP